MFGFGKLMHDYTPIGRISDAIHPGAFTQRPPELEPTNTPQRISYGVEQIAEYFVPGTAPARFHRAAQAGKAGLTALAQTDSPTQAGVSAALSAEVPGASTLTRAAGALETSAQKSMAQALGATKEWAKVEAQRIIPEMQRRGLGGSREAMLGLAKATTKRISRDLDDAPIRAAVPPCASERATHTSAGARGETARSRRPAAW